MIDVIIVEDEYLAREHIKRCIDWGELDCRISGEAPNGEDALELIRVLRPQLAIVDINMPFINGLEFSKIVHDEQPEIKIIILTGYGRFEYAKEALTAGVVGYLLKPVNREELTKAVINAKMAIEKEIAFKNNVKKLEALSLENENIARQKFINDILIGKNLEDTTGFEQYCPDVRNESLIVAVVWIDRLFQSNDKIVKDTQKLSACNIINEIFIPARCFASAFDMGGRLVVIMNIRDPQGNNIDYVKLFCKAICAIHAGLGGEAAVGIGRQYDSIGKVSKSYMEGLNALRHRIILGNNRVIEFDSLKSAAKQMALVEKIRKNLLAYLRAGNVRDIQLELHDIFECIVKDGSSVESLYFVLSEIYLNLNYFSYENGISINNFVGENFDPFHLIDQYESLSAIENQVFNVIGRLLEHTDKCSSNAAKIVKMARGYIKANYNNTELCLQNIAANVFTSQCHLSFIFKKEAGMSIVEYITDIRMVKAKELMDSGGKKLHEIAGIVGYKDPYYFSRCFRKRFGVSPSKYITSKNFINSKNITTQEK